MNLYHRKYETDAEARAAFQQDDPAIVKAGGTSWTAPADGAGPSYHVLALPNTVTPESLGITDAYLVTSFDESEEDDGELDAALDGVEDSDDGE